MAVRAEERREPWRDPQAQPYIRIEKVTKKFGEFVAVSDVSLSIYQKEIFCLLGGSGCGKTTLLRMLAGFETPTAGQIFIDGQDMAGVPPYKRPVNMMFQSYALFPHMTVEGNVAFGLKQDGLPKAEISEAVHAMLAMVKLEEFSGRKPHQLSGGQRQRVALARALVKRPKLLLLDEPLGALDKKLREHTQFELVNIQEKLGVTFVVVTHDQEEAMTLASRIGVMNKGRIVQVGTPHEIYEFPSTRFVSEFIGNVNMFEGRIVADEPDHVTISSRELGGTIYVGHGVSTAPEATVWAAVRPEKVMITREPPGAPLGVPDEVVAQAGENHCNAARGVIKEIAYMGDLSIYIVELPTGKRIRVTQPNTHRHAENSLTWDEAVWVSWHESSAVVVTE
jgi:putrescine transport system ATP-binding protein